MKKELADLKIGIIGAGHLGLTIAKVFLSSFLSAKNLLIAYSGNQETKKSIGDLGLSDRISAIEGLYEESDVAFIFVRPQNFIDFKKIAPAKGTFFVSGMAGVPINRLEKVFGKNVCRIMTSGPDTIRQKKAVAAIYPFNNTVDKMMKSAGFTTFILNEEQELHYFTVAFCLPAALVLAEKLKLPTDKTIDGAGPGYNIIRQLYLWAQSVIPEFHSDEESEEYVRKMATPGGITEAILLSLQANRDLSQALEAGVSRSMAISAGFE